MHRFYYKDYSVALALSNIMTLILAALYLQIICLLSPSLVLTSDIDIEPVVQHYLLYKTITILKILQSNGFVLLYFELANLGLY